MALIPQTSKSVSNGPLGNIIDVALSEHGYVEPVEEIKGGNAAQQYLNESGATLKSVLGTMTYLMNSAENESVRMKAVENCLTIHGVNLKNNEQGNNTQVNIVFTNANQGKQSLDNLLCPER